jgi:DNA-binding Lrp family transcriptional regulator
MIGKNFELDNIDQQIISLIQKDPNITHTEIAKYIDRSQPTVGIRLRKLQERGAFFIQPGVNFKMVDNLSIVKVKLNTKDPDKVFELSRCCPFILNCFRHSGDYNISLFMAGPTLDYIDAILNHHFRADEITNKVQMEVMLDMAKDFILPIDLNGLAKHNPVTHNCRDDCEFCNTVID